MRGRKLSSVISETYSRQIKKESPNEGTETQGHSTDYPVLHEPEIKKESPNEGTETVGEIYLVRL